MMQLISMVEAVEAVEDHEAKQRIPDNLKDRTFFGANDHWIYHTEDDDRVCSDCKMFDGALFTGEDLRRMLPDLDVVGGDMMMVNIHPSCRCFLVRVN